MSKILIKHGKVWSGERFFSADVLTDGDKIIKIEEGITDSADFVFDAKGKVVSAGLVDAHVHLRGLNRYFGIHPEMSSIPFGVTSAADACAIYGDKALIDSFMIKTVAFVPVEFRDNKAYFDSAQELLGKYGDKAVGVKVYFDTHISEVRDAEPLREVVEYADKNNLIIMVHSSNSPIPMAELAGALRKGDILTHAYHGGANNAGEDDFECIKVAKERGVIIDAGFAGSVHADFRIFEDAVNRGAIPDVISTDITRFSAYKRGGRYGLTMCMSFARQLGMCEEDIFRAVTSSPAKALGKEKQWGYLEVGRCADVAVLDYTDEGFELSNGVKGEKGYRCVFTVADGEVVYRD